ncbi:MAG TPA: ABC transporter substrate-binding protein [Frankiaceae bacterium]
MALHTLSRPLRAAAVALPLAGLLAACGSSSSSSAAPAAAANGKTITVTSANFAEDQLLAEMYAQALTKAGYKVNRKLNIGSREVYLKAMQNGEVDLVPDYVGTLTQVLYKQQTGHDDTADPQATGNLATTLANATTLAGKVGLVLYTPSPAADQNGFAVTQATAGRYGLTSLSDIAGKAQGKLVLGAGAECDTRPQCRPGLESKYGIQLSGPTKVFSESGGTEEFTALQRGDITLGLAFTSDGAVAADKLVVLKDDKGLATVDNIVPLIRKDKDDPTVKKTLDAVDAALTTDKLIELNRQINVDKADPATVAKQFLTSAGLL